TARQAGAQVIFGSDTHAVADLRPPADARKVLANAGLIEEEIGAAFSAAEALVVRALEREESR
ncbi:MAG TPA: hypothetical protein VM219_01015, partial [Phycisphaerae bacterium]|nr:hypothetical protein [Phycisphaerae bacterium]